MDFVGLIRYIDPAGNLREVTSDRGSSLEVSDWINHELYELEYEGCEVVMTDLGPLGSDIGDGERTIGTLHERWSNLIEREEKPITEETKYH